MNKELLQNRIRECEMNMEQIVKQREQLQANYNAFIGAKTECEKWLAMFEEAEKAAEINKSTEEPCKLHVAGCEG